MLASACQYGPFTFLVNWRTLSLGRCMQARSCTSAHSFHSIVTFRRSTSWRLPMTLNFLTKSRWLFRERTHLGLLSPSHSSCRVTLSNLSSHSFKPQTGSPQNSSVSCGGWSTTEVSDTLSEVVITLNFSRLVWSGIRLHTGSKLEASSMHLSWVFVQVDAAIFQNIWYIS